MQDATGFVCHATCKENLIGFYVLVGILVVGILVDVRYCMYVDCAPMLLLNACCSRSLPRRRKKKCHIRCHPDGYEDCCTLCSWGPKTDETAAEYKEMPSTV